MKILFFVFLFLSVYSYFIYPALLFISVLFRGKKQQMVHDRQDLKISLIITVHNEENRIRGKIESSLLLDYADGMFEIIVASDSSTDKTDEIVKEYKDHHVFLVRVDERKGKEYAQLQAINKASGDLIVFSDVATYIPKEGLDKLARYFDDPQVGAVSSEDRFISENGAIAGEGLYVRYEMWLREIESRLGGLVGLSGSFFAARRNVCLSGWDISSPSDFNTALNCARLKMRSLSCPDVNGFYKNIKNDSEEYNRKVRTVIRGITGLLRQPDVLNPFNYGVFSFQVWSHKVMRWIVPWMLLGLFIVSIPMVREGWFYQFALVGQMIFYGTVGTAWWNEGLRKYSMVRVAYYFIQSNMAIARASLMYMMGKRMVVWTPSKR